ncbi:HNH endonuclease signature motif containing protein [Arthrobacter sp. NEB 688]|uniref:HNH endonuclease signature motif containing protein n=1 Tax=Arthrobacter sp. NEB 688 TaxID=904039 RepID=UPI001564C526|nr:HNH endonuclease signature motif containing protein [Arthrobacter sp. NEB 688]QKE83464.1 HNH endonuclease [Arthrobacter sp. NEB 688]
MASTSTLGPGPGDVAQAAHTARRLVREVLSPTVACGSSEEWAAALGELRALADVVEAAQAEVVVRLAAIEPHVLGTGELVETHRAPGHVSLDAPSIVSGVLGMTAAHAERWVRDAVRRAADGPEGTGTATGLGRLHAAMTEGRVDGYRAGVVAHELEEVPAEVAATVCEAVDAFLGVEDAPRLRRRVRRVLARISPDLLRRRAVRARSASSLRRWVDEPGTDTWLGTFPSEEASRAWAAIDALAQRLVADGTCDGIDRARARALTDLVTGSATIDLQVHLVTVAPDGSPDGAVRSARSGAVEQPGDLVTVHGAAPGEPVLVARDWLERAVASTSCRTDHLGRVGVDPASGALSAVDGPTTEGYRPGARLARLVRARDGRCRFPGCQVAARFCDLDHVVAWPAGPTAATNLVCLCRRHHRTKQRPGWSALLHPDATMTWVDPAGRRRTTHPPDHRPVVLPDSGSDEDRPPRAPSLGASDAPHSALEFRLEHGAPAPTARACRVEVHRPRGRPPGDLVVDVPPRHRRRRPTLPSSPPF